MCYACIASAASRLALAIARWNLPTLQNGNGLGNAYISLFGSSDPEGHIIAHGSFVGDRNHQNREWRTATLET
jgi:hypothetical protein